jgi:gamma-D-glutamyl-L-lysine dipeptidyl-peptidase
MPWSSPAAAAEAAGYAIQVGVFASEGNAVRLTQSLEGKGLDAFFFAHESGFFKVQVGSFTTRSAAEKTARRLLQEGLIDEYFVVMRRPAPTPAGAAPVRPAEESLRAGLVETARSFIDFPYTWGGTTAEEGFDCSGLAMTVYRLNGITLPRAISEQMTAGIPIGRDLLKPGDLVFFGSQSGGTASHVGIYIGDGFFIHAPGRGKTVRREALAAAYFAARYLGARTYM